MGGKLCTRLAIARATWGARNSKTMPSTKITSPTARSGQNAGSNDVTYIPINAHILTLNGSFFGPIVHTHPTVDPGVVALQP